MPQKTRVRCRRPNVNKPTLWISRHDEIAATEVCSGCGYGVLEVRQSQSQSLLKDRTINGGNSEHAQNRRHHTHGSRITVFLRIQAVNCRDRVSGNKSFRRADFDSRPDCRADLRGREERPTPHSCRVAPGSLILCRQMAAIVFDTTVVERSPERIENRSLP